MKQQLFLLILMSIFYYKHLFYFGVPTEVLADFSPWLNSVLYKLRRNTHHHFNNQYKKEMPAYKFITAR
jgi:hypothetical protein